MKKIARIQDAEGRRAANMAAALRHAELGDRERILLHAYAHFEADHGAACGQVGLCWPTDAELAAFLGRSRITIRRARTALAEGQGGSAPLIASRYVPPFHALPDGKPSAHGVNVVTLLELAGRAGDVRPIALELADASAEVRALEAQLAAARVKAADAQRRLIEGRDAANDARTSRPGQRRIRGISVITPGCSPQRGEQLALGWGREGECKGVQGGRRGLSKVASVPVGVGLAAAADGAAA